MTDFPLKADLNGSPTQGTYKEALGQLYDAVDERLNTGATPIADPTISGTATFTGVAALAAGTAAAPAVARSGDLDTGLFFPAPNQVALATGGVKRLGVEEDGVVRIGGETFPAAEPAIVLEGEIAGSSAAAIYIVNTSNQALSGCEWITACKDSAGNLLNLVRLVTQMTDPTAGAVDAEFRINLRFTNTQRDVMSFANGAKIGSPSGGYKGLGTLNAESVFDDNVLLTCYVAEAARGALDPVAWDAVVADRVIEEETREVKTGLLDEAGKPIKRREVAQPRQVIERRHEPARRFAARAARDLDPAQYAAFFQAEGHLPAMPSREEWLSDGPISIGDLTQRLWETVEVQAVHIGKLTDRLDQLEGRLAALEASRPA